MCTTAMVCFLHMRKGGTSTHRTAARLEARHSCAPSLSLSARRVPEKKHLCQAVSTCATVRRGKLGRRVARGSAVEDSGAVALVGRAPRSVTRCGLAVLLVHVGRHVTVRVRLALFSLLGIELPMGLDERS